jgi:diguanylate cyclase (GGDEF)-like protein
MRDDRDGGIFSLIDSLSALRRLIAARPDHPVEDILQQAAQALVDHSSFDGCAIRWTLADGADIRSLTISIPDVSVAQQSALGMEAVQQQGRALLEQDLSRLADGLAGSLIVQPIRPSSGGHGSIAVWNARAQRFRPWHQNLMEVCATVLEWVLAHGTPCVCAPAAQAGNPESMSGRMHRDPAVASFEAEDPAPLQTEWLDRRTGLMNVDGFVQCLQDLLDTPASGEDVVHLLYFDIDRFRLIREWGGASAAEGVVRMVAELLNSQLGGHCALARLGGDHFGVLITDQDELSVGRLAQAVVDSVESFTLSLDSEAYCVSISAGIAALNCRHGCTADEMLQRARKACSEAQRHGGGSIQHYTDALEQQPPVHGDLWMLNELVRALKEGDLMFVAQPIVRTRRGVAPEFLVADHYELLLRLRDRRGRLHKPAAFMPLAERYGLCGKLDRWVVREAFSLLTESRTVIARQCVFTINLSGHSIGDESLLAFIFEQFRVSGLAPHQICFELTETVAISDMEAAKVFVEKLTELGCSFALDDFGSGHASFRYLKNLGVQLLKIDGSLVQGMLDEPVTQAIVRSVQEIGRLMEKQTVAEHIDSRALFDLATDVGVDYVQGEWVGRPTPLVDLLSLSAGHRHRSED